MKNLIIVAAIAVSLFGCKQRSSNLKSYGNDAPGYGGGAASEGFPTTAGQTYQKNFDDQIANLAKGVRTEPFSLACATLAMLYVTKADFSLNQSDEQRQGLYNQALEAIASCSEAEQASMVALKTEIRLKLGESIDSEEFEAILQNAAGATPIKNDLRNLRFAYLLSQGDVDQAKEILASQAGLDRRPQNWMMLGTYQERNGDREGAQVSFQTAMAAMVDPNPWMVEWIKRKLN